MQCLRAWRAGASQAQTRGTSRRSRKVTYKSETISVMDQLIMSSYAPNEGRPQPSHKRTHALRPPDRPCAVQSRLVFLPFRGGKPIRLYPRLDHVYRVNYRPQLPWSINQRPCPQKERGRGTHRISRRSAEEDGVRRVDLVPPDTLARHLALHELLVHEEVNPVAERLAPESHHLALVYPCDPVSGVYLLDGVPGTRIRRARRRLRLQTWSSECE